MLVYTDQPILLFMQLPTTNKLTEKKNKLKTEIKISLFKLSRNTILTEWFDKHDSEVGHQSPDLNIIETCLGVLEEPVRKR